MSTITESAPMKASELGRYVCVRNCQHTGPRDTRTIRSDGVWVRSPGPDTLNPGSHVYSSAHRDCYEAWADDQGATRVDGQPNGMYHVTSGGVTRQAGTRTDALALAEYLAAPRAPVDPELFKRTAPAWNCVSYPGGMHYLAGEQLEVCAWCGMTRAEIAEDDARREEARP
jgi:hypothetical protein